MSYVITSYDLDDEIVNIFDVPVEMTSRLLEIVGVECDGHSEYSLSKLTLEVLKRTLAKYGFKYDYDLYYTVRTK